MKRLGNLYEQIYDMDNLVLADNLASKGKSSQYGVIVHQRNKMQNLSILRQNLIDKNYKTSMYKTFKIFEPKERDIFSLPYFPDRILHHAIMNILEPIFVSCFTKDTYSCIKNRGVHAASNELRTALNDYDNTEYCLKLDIKKFYPSIDHVILKQLLRRKFKDQDLLQLLDEIIDSAPGVPIGNYLSQYFANFYLTYFDHWIKEVKQVKYYFRYADDIVILGPTKTELHKLLTEIREYLQINLKLTVKQNYQIFPVASRGIDFVGYKHYHSHILLRKSIKQRFARMLKNNKNSQSIASYLGWTKHCDARNLEQKLLS